MTEAGPLPLKWRPMKVADVDGMLALAEVLYPDHPEERDVILGRLSLYPAGCKVSEREGEIVGYAISHPWVSGQPPSLNAKLIGLPPKSDIYYLHDIAIAPAAQGKGVANAVVVELLAHARSAGFRNAELVAVNGSAPFWSRHGFHRQPPSAMARKLTTYGEGAVYMKRPLV